MERKNGDHQPGDEHDHGLQEVPVDIAEALLPLLTAHGGSARMCGWVLAGGRGWAPFPDGNPWGLRDEADPIRAFVRLWGGVEQEFPTFVAELGCDLAGIAMLRVADEYLLAYLFPRPNPLLPYGDEPGRSIAADPPLLVFGYPPRRFPDSRSVGAWDRPVPAPIRVPAAVHGRMTSEHGTIELDMFEETLRDVLLEWDRDDGEEDGEITSGSDDMYSRHICIGEHSNGWVTVLVLDEVAPDGTPLVAYYDQDGLGWVRMPFREWFDIRAVRHLVGRSPDRGRGLCVDGTGTAT